MEDAEGTAADAPAEETAEETAEPTGPPEVRVSLLRGPLPGEDAPLERSADITGDAPLEPLGEALSLSAERASVRYLLRVDLLEGVSARTVDLGVRVGGDVEGLPLDVEGGSPVADLRMGRGIEIVFTPRAE